MKKLFKGIDNTGAQTFWKGNEDNFDRFLKVLYGLWQGSKYANPEGYTYVDELLDDGDLSPRVLTYDGESWFPNVSYEPTVFNQKKVRIATKTIYGRYGNLVYEYFQPVWIVFENNGKGKITKTEVPAIYFAGTAKKDNLEKSLDQIGLTIDMALTLTAFGNVTKLGHLTRLKQIGRITLAGVEVSSATADILIRYTDLCDGNEVFCEAFQQYNTYLQLGLLGSGLLKAKFTASRTKAQEAYVAHREKLISKYGADDPTIKELDGHFGVVRADVGVYTTKIKWGIMEIEARPFDKGYWGKRVKQSDARIDAYELKINPNNESFYLPNSEGSFVQFENLKNTILQDGKLVMDKSSIYHVLDKPEFLRTEAILKPARRQVSAAKEAGYIVEWLVSDQKAVEQLTQYFEENNIDIIVKLLTE